MNASDRGWAVGRASEGFVTGTSTRFIDSAVLSFGPLHTPRALRGHLQSGT
ncbi:MAG: hypothetical protein O2997_03570 [Proteobacteria bacterium]|nr:hypothetical protein [Pseudomonadota bacterium]